MPAKQELLEYPGTIEQAIKIQKKWKERYQTAVADVSYRILKINEIKTVAAVDISYDKHNSSRAVACVVLWDFSENKEIAKAFAAGKIKFPYKSGLLAFREANLSADVVNQLSERPDIIMLDGHGFCHPERFGEATHIGYALDIPSFGVAKSPFYAYVDYKSMKKQKGNARDIIKDGNILGKAMVLGDDRSPVFISAGYRVDLPVACEISLMLTANHKQPEPLFLADRYSREKLS